MIVALWRQTTAIIRTGIILKMDEFGLPGVGILAYCLGAGCTRRSRGFVAALSSLQDGVTSVGTWSYFSKALGVFGASIRRIANSIRYPMRSKRAPIPTLMALDHCKFVRRIGAS